MADEVKILVKGGEKTSWDKFDKTANRLTDREIGYDKTNSILKVGNGVDKFADLPLLKVGSAEREYSQIGPSAVPVRTHRMTNLKSKSFKKDADNPLKGKIKITFPKNRNINLGYITLKILIYFYDTSSTTEILFWGYPITWQNNSTNTNVTSSVAALQIVYLPGCSISNTSAISTAQIALTCPEGAYSEDKTQYTFNAQTAELSLLLGENDSTWTSFNVFIEEAIGSSNICDPEDFKIELFQTPEDGNGSDDSIIVKNVAVNSAYYSKNLSSITNNTENIFSSKKGVFGTFLTGSQTDIDDITRNYITPPNNSFLFGKNNGIVKNSYNTKIVLGENNTILNDQTCMIGFGLLDKASSSNCLLLGAFNNPNTLGMRDFAIGNGLSSKRRNAIRITSNNDLYSSAAWNTSGADYAEYFEWEDGNWLNEDRVGLFVTHSGDKIKLANKGDFIIGAISANPSCVGGNPEEWNNRFLKDIYGRIQTKEVKVEDRYEDIEVETEEFNENGEPIIKLEKTLIKGYSYKEPIINPDFDESKEYIERNKRREWSPVGLVGQLIIKDDGTSNVGDFCTASYNGIATKSQEETRFKVLKRLNNNHIKILIL